MIAPSKYVWIVEGRLAVAERPGGGGRAHRVVRRDAELAWWRAQGVTTIVSAMRTRHGLLDAALGGYAVRWHPLVDERQAVAALPALVACVARELDARPGEAVLVHADRANEWVAALDARLRMRFGRVRLDRALAQAAGDGFPVGRITYGLLGVAPVPATPRGARSPGIPNPTEVH